MTLRDRPEVESAIEKAALAIREVTMTNDDGPTGYWPCRLYAMAALDALLAAVVEALGEQEGLDFRAASNEASRISTFPQYDSAEISVERDRLLDAQHRARVGALRESRDFWKAGWNSLDDDNRALRVRVQGLEKDAARWRWLVRTFTAAKGGASLVMNDDLAVYQTPEPGKECRIQWYPDTPVGFYVSEAATMDAAIDYAMQPEEAP